MKFSAYIVLTATALTAVPLLSGCHTSEENYRAAYEKTVAARAESDSLEHTIYGAERRRLVTAQVETPDGPVEVRRQLVRVTDGGGGINENLHQYNVVVGQFKQLFNAKSLRERLVDMGYPGAFVVETGEPFYFIVLDSFDDVAEASHALEAFRSSGKIAMKEPCPFILDASRRRRPRN